MTLGLFVFTNSDLCEQETGLVSTTSIRSGVFLEQTPRLDQCQGECEVPEDFLCRFLLADTGDGAASKLLSQGVPREPIVQVRITASEAVNRNSL